MGANPSWWEPVRLHEHAIAYAGQCPACARLLVAAIRKEAMEEAAKIVEQPSTTNVCGSDGTIPAASVNEIVTFALRLAAKSIRRALSLEEGR